ncbi:S8 family serine peptidase [Actinoplanes sp. NEAU-A12]|uniref:S8 family serine peptidase n=1 Tax=Actinoplanes sandaracinus TaxID=3045177 RepID=A0ABT6WYF8_9ACTN|nr:S8 family serine peptidase [Actinoplanes sandaracinus]MDI6104785.1 S8 family serine peptidase [Actinoplanes sandaracinus]
MRRYAVGALATGVLAAVAAFALPSGTTSWQPVTYGLTEDPQRLVPQIVSAEQPARVLSTARDAAGRPVVTVRQATDRAGAIAAVTAGQQAQGAIGVELDAPVSALGVPAGTDVFRSRQWSLTTMNVPPAWQASTGTGITVAVIDSGVDAAHPDLAGQILPGIDLVADVEGVSTDPNGHGTHVAGIIAAVTGNGAGVTAVAPHAKILPIRALDAHGAGYMSDTATGIVYAADHGAHVINMSLGGAQPSAAVSNAISYARSKGVVVVAAAGNSRADGSPTSYPAADEGVIAVASSTSGDEYSSFSNRGDYIDVTAPGSDIISTYPTATGNAYVSMSGTSMAAPHVAALAALLKGHRPALTPGQVQQAMQTSAVDLGTAGKDSDYGYGRVDAAAALAAILPATTGPTRSPSTGTVVPGAPRETVPASSSPLPTTAAPSPSPTTVPATSTPPAAPPSTTATPTPAPTTPAQTPSPPPSTSPTLAPPAPPSPVPTAPTPALVKPVITANVKAQTVGYGTKVRVTFTVKAHGKAWARKAVHVCDPAGCKTRTTSSSGTVISDPYPVKGRYAVYLKVPATTTTTAVTSAASTFTASAAVNATRHSKTAIRVQITGAAGQTVRIQRLSGKTWVTVKTYRAAASATVSRLTARKTYRVVVTATDTIGAATSRTVRL